MKPAILTFTCLLNGTWPQICQIKNPSITMNLAIHQNFSALKWYIPEHFIIALRNQLVHKTDCTLLDDTKSVVNNHNIRDTYIYQFQ